MSLAPIAARGKAEPALTDLMGGERYDGMIEYYEQLCEAVAHGVSPRTRDIPNGPLRAPDGVSTLFTKYERMV